MFVVFGNVVVVVVEDENPMDDVADNDADCFLSCSKKVSFVNFLAFVPFVSELAVVVVSFVVVVVAAAAAVVISPELFACC